jgi:hypothetical protein
MQDTAATTKCIVSKVASVPKHHTIVIDRPIDWAGLRQELKPVLTYIIGIVTGIVITLSSHYQG